MGTLYSIGYGNRTWGELRQLLRDRDCEFLIDVRSRPYSKYNVAFSKDSLVALCSEAKIRYVFMGNVLGGKPASADYCDAEGKVNYSTLAKSNLFQCGLDRLLVASNKRVKACIMCSELRPQDCHRCRLIGVELKEKGVDVLHIDENGINISQEEAIFRITGGQTDMFGNAIAF